MTDSLPIIRPVVVYRCRKCGKLAYGYAIQPADDNPPKGDCGCYTGPRWERGVWFPEPAHSDGTLRCGFCGQEPEEHGDSDAGPMSVCPTHIDGDGDGS